MNTRSPKVQKNKRQGVSIAGSHLKSDESTFQLVDNRPEIATQRKLQEMANNSPQVRQLKALQEKADAHAMQRKEHGVIPIMLKKDAALWSAKEKDANLTPTKIIKTKGGAKGIFRFPMNGVVIDTFQGVNVADESKKPPEHSDAKKMEIPVAVQEHDLKQGKGNIPALTDIQIQTGSRDYHFDHADATHGIPRKDKYTWHHKNSFGKMELIDMNVHGAMWHYGGMANWNSSIHDGDDADDDGPSKDL